MTSRHYVTSHPISGARGGPFKKNNQPTEGDVRTLLHLPSNQRRAGRGPPQPMAARGWGLPCRLKRFERGSGHKKRTVMFSSLPLCPCSSLRSRLFEPRRQPTTTGEACPRNSPTKSVSVDTVCFRLAKMVSGGGVFIVVVFFFN